jgi:hypothetical protein
MGFLVSRSGMIDSVCDYLRTAVPELKLVKPYHGEFDRYVKTKSLKDDSFPAMVNLTTPFALVISKDRKRVEGKGQSVRFRHYISVYIGDANPHDFNNQEVPQIFALLDKCTEALDGKVLARGAGALSVESDGQYLITTDLFVVYDQQYSQLEIGT